MADGSTAGLPEGLGLVGLGLGLGIALGSRCCVSGSAKATLEATTSPPAQEQGDTSAVMQSGSAPSSIQAEMLRAAADPITCGSDGMRRSAVYARHGMVSCSQPLASEIGLRVLQSGGNAVDAAIAMAAALAVTTPTMTGLGGDMFMLFWDAKERKVKALNGSGRCPKALTVETVREAMGVGEEGLAYEGTAGVPDPKSIHCITVPGSCAGWCDAVEHWGSKPISEVLQPAIELAKEGFAVAPISSVMWNASRKFFDKWKHGAGQTELLLPSGHAPQPGEIFANPAMAKVLECIAVGGKDAFYKGEIAERIVSHSADATHVRTSTLRFHTVYLSHKSLCFANHCVMVASVLPGSRWKLCSRRAGR
jgi:gamma-glutamyltranspeptidase